MFVPVYAFHSSRFLICLNSSYDVEVLPLSILRNPLDRFDDKQCAAVFDEFRILRADLNDPACNLGMDRREKFHDFDQAKCIALADDAADFDEWRSFRIGRAIERSDHGSGNFNLTSSGFDLQRGGSCFPGRGRSNGDRCGAAFNIFRSCRRGNAIPAHHNVDIACFDNKFIAGAAVDELYDFGNLIVSQHHAFSCQFEWGCAGWRGAVNGAAAACRRGTWCRPCSSDMRASGAEIASAATRCPPAERTGTATHTTPAKNSWLSIEISIFRMASSSASSFAAPVMVFSV